MPSSLLRRNYLSFKIIPSSFQLSFESLVHIYRSINFTNDFKCSVASIFNRLAENFFRFEKLVQICSQLHRAVFCFALTFELECVCTYIYSREKYKKPVVTFEFHGKLGRTLPTRCEYFTRAKRMERRGLFGYVTSSVDKG